MKGCDDSPKNRESNGRRGTGVAEWDRPTKRSGTGQWRAALNHQQIAPIAWVPADGVCVYVREALCIFKWVKSNVCMQQKRSFVIDVDEYF